MKTRYKISIIVIISLVAVSFFVPEVFLIFYLDKFESNDNCNALGGNWDWVNDICELDGIENSDQMCMDVGGVPSCKVHCPRPFGIFTPWQLLPIFGCTLPCYPACDFDAPLEKVLEHDAYVVFKERFPDAKERYNSNAYGFSVSVWETNAQTNNELYVHMEYNEIANRTNVNVFCTSRVTNEHIKTEMDDNLAVDFIQTTDCLDVDAATTSCPEFVEKLNNVVFHCPAISAPTKMKILQVDGFDICGNESYDKYYTLEPGGVGQISYTVYRGNDGNDPPAEPEYKDIIREPLFLQEINTEEFRSRIPFTPDGIHVLYESDLTRLGFNQTATVTVTVSVDPDVTEQSMWLGLPPFACHGGAYAKFAIVE